MIRDWVEEGKKLAPTVEVEVHGQKLQVRRIANLGWWQSVARRAEAAALAGPFGVPEAARRFLPEDAEACRDLIRSAILLEALLAEPNEADVATLLELASVNAPVYAELVAKVARQAVEMGAAMEAAAIDEAKKN
jgi:hypothetical protein